MQKNLWTPEEVENLKRLSETLTPSKIALEINRSRDSVRHKLKWLKRQKSKPVAPPAPPKEKLVKMVKRESRAKGNISYPPLEWCTSCHSPVSNWEDHTARMGCTRPM